jgi:hypothetical protein
MRISIRLDPALLITFADDPALFLKYPPRVASNLCQESILVLIIYNFILTQLLYIYLHVSNIYIYIYVYIRTYIFDQTQKARN